MMQNFYKKCEKFRTGLIILFTLILMSCATTPFKQSSKMYVSLGDLYARANYFADAENYYLKASALEPNNNEISYKLADVQIQEGKLNQAETIYHQILLKQPQEHQARYRLARLQLTEGEWELALSQYQLLLQTNEKDFQALNGLGVLLDNLSQFSLAKICYQQGLKYAPQDYAILNNLGVSYALSDNLAQSQYYLNRAMTKATNSRPQDNLKLVREYYKKFDNVKDRQQALHTAFFIKKGSVSSSTTEQAKESAKKWCS